MSKSVSARATYNVQLASKIFSSPEVARETMKAIIESQTIGRSFFQVHGVTLRRGKTPRP